MEGKNRLKQETVLEHIIHVLWECGGVAKSKDVVEQVKVRVAKDFVKTEEDVKYLMATMKDGKTTRLDAIVRWARELGKARGLILASSTSGRGTWSLGEGLIEKPKVEGRASKRADRNAEFEAFLMEHIAKRNEQEAA